MSAPQQILEDHTILRSEVLPTGDNGVNLPVNLKRLIWNAQQLFKVKPNRKAPSGAPSRSCLLFGLQLSACQCSHVRTSIGMDLIHHLHAGLDPLEVVEKVQELCLKLVVVKVGCSMSVDTWCAQHCM